MRRYVLAVLSLTLALQAQAAITGRVIDPDGKPLGGVRVRAFARETTEAMFARFVSASPQRQPVSMVETKADGTFAVDGKGNGVVDLALDAPGHEAVSAEAIDGEDAGSFILKPAKRIRGRVTAGGKPVANAAVILGGDDVVRTADDGSFEIDSRTPTFRAWHIVVIHPDYAPATEPNRTSSWDFELRSGDAIAGRVLAADGKTPVGGATVRVGAWPLARSGEDGTFRIAHAPAAAGAVSAVEGTRIGRIAFDKRRASYDIVLRPGATIAGSVRSSRDDVPVAGARITLAADAMPPPSTAITDAKGNFAFSPVLPAELSLFVSHPGYSNSEQARIEAGEGARVTKTLTLAPAARIRGVVADEKRRPVAAARIVANAPNQTVTRPDGTFLLRVQRTGAPVTITASKSGFAAATAGPLTLQAGEAKSVQLSLARGFRFEIQLVDGDGNPIAGEPLMLMHWMDPDDAQSRTPVACSENDPSACLVTDSAGKRSYDLLDGKYSINAGGRTTLARQLPPESIDARSKPLVITLTRGAVIEGRVVGADEQPVEGAVVTASPRESGMATSDASGAFAIRSAAAGATITLMAETRSGLQSDVAIVTAPVHDVVLRLPRASRIEGRVFDRESKQPVRDYTVAIARQRRSFIPKTRRVSSDDGRFVFEEVTPGEIDLTVRAKGYAPGSVVDVKAAEGSTATVDIALDRGAVVTGRVTAGGKPLADVLVSALSPALRGQRPPEARSDAAGEFTFDGLPAGSQRFDFRKAGYVSKSATADLVLGKENRVNAELEHGLALSGRVVDSAGRGLALAEVSARGAQGIPTLRTDGEGTFQIEELADRTYTIAARKDGYLNAEVEANPARTPTITITLGRGGSLTGKVSGVSESELQSVEVGATGPGGWRTTMRPDAGGNFTLTGVPDGRVELRATQIRPPRTATETKIVEVENGTGPFVQLDFTSGIAVRGRITRAGQPVEGTVTFAPVGPAMQRAGTAAWAELGAGGAYEVRLGDRGDYVVRVQRFGRGGGATRKVTVAGPMTLDVDIAGTTLRGRVIDERTGAPIAGAMVEIAAPSFSSNSMSDSDGRFSFDDMPDDKYRLSARREHFVSDPQEIVVAGGAPEIEVRLRQAVAVGVKVVDAADGHLLDANIFARPKGARPGPNTGSGPAPRGENGMQRLWLLPGEYVAEVWVQGYARRSIDVQVPGPDVHVMLERGGVVVVHGTVAGSVWMRLQKGTTRVASASARSPRFESVPPGVYVLEVVDAQQKVIASRAGVTVVGGQTTTITLE